MNQHAQTGIAVISAMLLAALTATIVGNMVWKQQLLISELENQQNATQANWIADAATHWSRAILAEDGKLGNVDHNKEPWATKLPATPVEGGDVTGWIVDQQQFFNLNNLKTSSSENDPTRKAYGRLLESLGINTNIIDVLKDWIDEDDLVSSLNGAENHFYLDQIPAYAAANQPLTEMGNLVRLKGYDKAIIDKISPFTTILPDNTPVNVNTASAEVLSFVLPNITLQQAQTIVATRNIEYFKDLGDFSNRLPNKSIDLEGANISVNSQFFLVTCVAHFGKTSIKVEALLFRGPNKNWPTILWKRYG